NHCAPAYGSKVALGDSIAVNVSFELRQPVIAIAFRLFAAELAGMLMPEAAMNENHLSSPRENQVRRAWQIVTVQAKSIAHAVSKASDNKLGLCIRLSDTAHLLAGLRLASHSHATGDIGIPGNECN